MKVFMLCMLGIIMIGGITPVHASVRFYKFELRRSSHARLCTNKTMLTINGQFPGPTIYARRGDLVIVDVANRADQNITIHWHGVKMRRYPWSDGTNFVTQCPIGPGKRFRQRIVLSDEEGTLWWHAHSDWSRATVHGAIIILPPRTEIYPFPKPHAHLPIFLGEWWNCGMQELMKEFMGSGRDPPNPDALLMNGQPGHFYPCSTQDTFKLSVEPGKTYLIKLISAMMDLMMFFKIANHNLTIVGSDGAYTTPLATDYVAISPGQTIDLLLEANQAPSHYYIASKAYGGDFVPTTGIIEYVGNYTPPPSPSYPEFSDSASIYLTNHLTRPATGSDDVPRNITRNLFLALSINQWPCDSCWESERLVASMNNVSMLLPGTDVLEAYYGGMGGVFTADFPDHPPKAFDYTQGSKQKNESRPQFATAVYMLDYNSGVEIVFQGTNLGHGMYHPIHLHGYSFYLVGSGFGNFDPTMDPPAYNLLDPPLMETVAVPKNGWAAIRFKANNPGVWFMHCHFERHQSWGMKMVLIVKDGEAPNQKMLPPPPDMPSCQTSSSLQDMMNISALSYYS